MQQQQARSNATHANTAAPQANRPGKHSHAKLNLPEVEVPREPCLDVAVLSAHSQKMPPLPVPRAVKQMKRGMWGGGGTDLQLSPCKTGGIHDGPVGFGVDPGRTAYVP